LLVFKDLEQVEQGDHLEGLDCEFGRIQQLDRTSLLLGGSQDLHQQPDPAGIDPGNFAQVHHDARIAAGQQIVQGLPEAIYCVTQIQPATQLDQLHLAQTAEFDIQSGLTSRIGNGSTAGMR
jgi:hypothetical protein